MLRVEYSAGRWVALDELHRVKRRFPNSKKADRWVRDINRKARKR